MNFFEGYFDTGQQIGSWEARCEYWGALVHFFHTGEVPDIASAEARIAFTASKPSVELSRKRASAGRDGGEAKAANAAKSEASRKKTDKQASGKSEAKQKQTVKQKPRNMNMKMKEKMKGEKTLLSAGEADALPYEAIVARLNEAAGTKFRADSAQTRSMINGRFAEGYTLDDFFHVIDVKCAKWNREPRPGEKDMRPYLRPKTLFAPGNFESYVNEIGGGAGVDLGKWAKPDDSAF
ncbi:conserved phage C-terminal domain-containing protein [Adlercreutzia sp. R25]|uniref:Conserved phage C-terminal domain-containing protein n=1 Tax=Adlercreutzia shanghongiae TaxID=3111773 RepID=A0ABU6IX16_9ACTN|nr:MULTISPECIES: conserved phage C-terminal domain-containing protein [unclassified Adlercreutzia]MEC4272713.1 conserved phage C-terminal domain-containing protein [Adlercreutzia sp. R25]MEC4294387.1 conserved phage C-terminal domain-containing protein [Adlercreutzia sp. R22]